MANKKSKTIILHGWTYETSKWQPFLEMLDKKITYDFPKIPGLTTELDDVWTLDDYVEWLKKLVDTETVNLIGHSNGGRIAIAFCLKYPKLVDTLILIDSAGIRDMRLTSRLKRIFFGTIAKLGKKILPLNGLRVLLYRLTREQDYKEASPKLRKTMQNLIEVDLRDKASKIKIKTLIIWGENDTATPLKDGRLLHKKISDSRLVIVKKARHSPMFTHPQKVANEILKFL